MLIFILEIAMMLLPLIVVIWSIKRPDTTEISVVTRPWMLSINVKKVKSVGKNKKAKKKK